MNMSDLGSDMSSVLYKLCTSSGGLQRERQWSIIDSLIVGTVELQYYYKGPMALQNMLGFKGFCSVKTLFQMIYYYQDKE